MKVENSNYSSEGASTTRLKDVVPWEYVDPIIPQSKVVKGMKKPFKPFTIVMKLSEFNDLIQNNRVKYNAWQKKNGFQKPYHGE